MIKMELIRQIKAKGMSLKPILLFSFFVKPNEKATPRYNQNNYKLVHSFSIRQSNEKSNCERTKNPSNNIPITVHINLIARFSVL